MPVFLVISVNNFRVVSSNTCLVPTDATVPFFRTSGIFHVEGDIGDCTVIAVTLGAAAAGLAIAGALSIRVEM